MTKPKYTILAIDDEKDMLKTLQNILKKQYNLLTTKSAKEALKIIQEQNIDLVLLDIRMPEMDGVEVLKQIRATFPNLETVMVTASKDVATAVEAMKLGAFDYIAKPFEVKELLTVIEKALEKRSLVRENLYLKEALAQASSYCELLGKTPQMKKIFETIDTVCQSNSRVLITGESGTGKELVALAIHKKSPRAKAPFIAINCAALPENLLESELFGYERGAFTGALERKLGKFELADGGTIFLDEIGCMSPAMQAKLLRVIQEKTIDRVGGTSPITIDVRILAASNIDFKKAIAEKIFRDDLYYRLNVIPIHVPPLRERKEDIPLFLDYFIDKYKKELNRPLKGYAPEALQVLSNYDWPGNVRELQNIVERVVTLSRNKLLSKDDFAKALMPAPERISVPENQGLKESTDNFERECIRKALEKSDGNRSQAAKLLNIARSTLISKMDALGLS